MERRKPELLAPAGDMERLRAAVDYGADAVYLGGKNFGMRSAPANFSCQELEEGVALCHRRGGEGVRHLQYPAQEPGAA